MPWVLFVKFEYLMYLELSITLVEGWHCVDFMHDGSFPPDAELREHAWRSALFEISDCLFQGAGVFESEVADGLSGPVEVFGQLPGSHVLCP